MQFPIFLVTKERVAWLRQMVEWFEKAGQEEIYFVDNDSTYPPLVEFFRQTPHTVLQVGYNLGWQSPWQAGYVERIAGDRFYVAGDSDMVPTEECPFDALDVFYEALSKYEPPQKISFCLKLDDIPSHYPHKSVVDGMSKVHQNESNIVDGKFVRVPVDGIPSLYRPGVGHNKASWMSMRHEIRHMSWYEDMRHPNPELAHYQARANHDISMWSWPKLNDDVMQRLEDVKKQGLNGEWLSLEDRT